MKFLDVPPRYRSHTESKCSWKKSGFIRLTALKADFDDILAGFRGILLSVTNLDFTRICQDWIGLAKFTRTYPDICLTQIFVFFSGSSNPTYTTTVCHPIFQNFKNRHNPNCSIYDQKWPKGQFLWWRHNLWRHKLNGADWYFRNSLLAQKWFEFNHQCTNRNIHES